MNVLTPSKDRVEEPVCPMARKCGGCQIQEMKYPAQLAFKEAKVRGNLERIGEVPGELLDQIMHPAVGMDGEGMQPFRYRNKAQFPIGTDKDGRVIAGFYAGRTHSIIENTDCALGVEVNEEILNCILDFMEEFKIPAYDEVKHKGWYAMYCSVTDSRQMKSWYVWSSMERRFRTVMIWSDGYVRFRV